MDSKAKNELADLKKRKVTYKQAYDNVKATAQKIQQELHDAHPLPGLTKAMGELDLLIMGCDQKIKRLESIGR